jgi:hypothetical protein
MPPFSMIRDMLRFLGQGFVFSCKSVAPRDLGRKLLTYLQIAVNDISKYASVTEDLARIAELICRFALTEELYLQGTSKAVKELEKTVVKLYAHILGFLSTAKQYLEQGTVSTYMLSTTRAITDSSSERTLKSAFVTETDLGSGLNEIQAAEKGVNRCMVLVDRMGPYQHLFILNSVNVFCRQY